MFGYTIFTLMIATSLVAADIKPVVGILPFQIPEKIRNEMKENHNYISAGLSRWLETYHTRWIPIDPHDPNVVEKIKKINGIMIMGEIEEYGNPELIRRYNADISALFQLVENENKSRYFPLLAVGFGAQLVFNVLTNQKYRLIDLPLKNKFIKFEYTENPSTVIDLEPDFRVLLNGEYPNLGEKFIPMSLFENDEYLKNEFVVVAKGIPNGFEETHTVVGFYEYLKLPVFGLLSDYHTVHFSHGLLEGKTISEEDLDRGFYLSKLFANILKKNDATAGNEFVTEELAKLKYFMSSNHSEQFEEMFLKEL